MQTRPSVVYFRRRCYKRRSLRCWLVFLCCLLLLVCCEVHFLLSLILAGIVTLVFRLWVFGLR